MATHRKYSIRYVGPDDADYSPTTTTSPVHTAAELAADEAPNWKDGVRIDVWDGHNWQDREPDFTMTVGQFKPDDEVCLTLRGRFIAESGGRLVLEYVNSTGFPDRIAVDRNSRDVWANLEIAPESTKRRRSEAVGRVASGCADRHARDEMLASLPYDGRYATAVSA